MAASYTRDDLRAAAGSKSFQRGEGYVDAVANLRLLNGVLHATVYGREPYRVQLGIADGGLGGDCTCPHAADGYFCKHLVAVGLAKLDGVGTGEGPEDDEQGDDGDTLRAYLRGLNHDELVDLLADAAAEDERLDSRLRMAASREALSTTDASNLGAFSRQVSEALRAFGYLDYQGTRDYSERVASVAELLGGLLDDGHAKAAVTLAQQALDQLGEVYDQADDSSGALGGAVCELAQVHMDACAADPPEPADLAAWLVHQQLTRAFSDPFDAEGYAEALGDEGLDSYAALLRERWKNRVGDWSDYRLKYLMDRLAASRGDVDERIAILSEDLQHPGIYLRIAEILAEANRTAEAVEWAERGLATDSGSWPSDALIDFLAREYTAAGRADDALSLRRDHFQRHPDVSKYRALREAAGDAWPEQRRWAMDALHEHACQVSAHQFDSPSAPLVNILLDEGDLEGAWAAATRYGVHHHLMLDIAQRRADRHPADALPVFRTEVERRVAVMSRESYRLAAEWLVRIRELHDRLGTPEEGGRLVTKIRTEHRRKRNLMAELDAHGL